LSFHTSKDILNSNTVANPTATVNHPYFAEDIHSPFSNDNDNTFALTMSTSNDAYGKAPMRAEAPNVNGGGVRPGGTNIVSVEPPKATDLQPSYAHTMPEDPANLGWYGKMIHSLGGFCGTLGSIPCCVCCPNPYKQVYEGQTGLILKFGKYHRAVDPGLCYVNPLSEKMQQVDIKITVVEVPSQVCMTKDNVNVHITSVIYFHIVNPYKATFGVGSVRTALMERTQTTLRHVLGARVLQDVIERREEIAQSIEEIIAEVATTWGVKVESILIKDINFSRELQDSLSMAAQSKRIGESKIIAARAEVESAKLMRQAADILASKAAMQIRYLEAMQAMAKSSNSKVIFMPSASGLNQMASNVASNNNMDNEGATAGPSGEQNMFGVTDPGFQQAINASIVENI